MAEGNSADVQGIILIGVDQFFCFRAHRLQDVALEIILRIIVGGDRGGKRVDTRIV